MEFEQKIDPSQRLEIFDIRRDTAISRKALERMYANTESEKLNQLRGPPRYVTASKVKLTSTIPLRESKRSSDVSRSLTSLPLVRMKAATTRADTNQHWVFWKVIKKDIHALEHNTDAFSGMRPLRCRIARMIHFAMM